MQTMTPLPEMNKKPNNTLGEKQIPSCGGVQGRKEKGGRETNGGEERISLRREEGVERSKGVLSVSEGLLWFSPLKGGDHLP